MSNAAQLAHSEVSRPSLVRLVILLSVPTAVVVYAVAFQLSIADLGLDSRAYPQAIIAVLLVLVLSQVFSEVLNWWRSRDATRFSQIWRPWKRTALSALWTMAFAWGIGVVGFYESLALYGLVLLPLLGVRRPVTVIGFNAGVIVGVYLLFDAVLNVRLPGGLLVG